MRRVAACAVVGIFSIVVACSPSRPIAVAPAESSVAASTDASEPASTGQSPATALPPATVPPSAAPTVAPTSLPPVGIARPFVDPSICTSISAGETPFSEYTMQPFARAATGALPIQAFAHPATGPRGPFAVVLRYSNQDRRATGNSNVEINGWSVAIHTFPNGNGEAIWNLDDGTQGYLRSRGMSVDVLTAIVGGLTPRDADAAIAGFDYTPPADDTTGIEFVAEHTASGLSGHGARFECRVDSAGIIYRISAIEADPISEYVSVIDRPPPVAVGLRDTTLIVITGDGSGRPDPTAPTINQVTNADPAVWAQLLRRPAA